MSDGTWIRLQRGNDWGVDYLSAGTPHQNGLADRKRAIHVEDGDPVDVRWPDGSVTAETVKHKICHYTVGDMGHSYPVTYRLPGFERVDRGVTKWFALDEVDVRQGRFQAPKVQP